MIPVRDLQQIFGSFEEAFSSNCSSGFDGAADVALSRLCDLLNKCALDFRLDDGRTAHLEESVNGVRPIQELLPLPTP